ncbi:hypothetical protein AVEN_246578-1 [Araneus ventricosus]|uniref:Uncharacterized protein n=1 Tax=Araneus ventricosus TaxID=182803 RepID=A0A4Y2DCG4_ARAVE|nr:hypothetical protein AVEN_246578-1 [Araneus ventricosus]
MLALCFIDPHKPSITGWQVTLSAFLLLVPELFEEKKFVLLSRFNQDALENYFSQVRLMTIPLQWTSCTRTRMLLAELMFAMCGNANYEPDDNIILESTQIIPQTDEYCLDLVIDEPSWIAQKHRKIGMIWSSTCHLCGRLHFKKNFRKSTVNSANQIYASNATTATIIFLSFKEFANSKTGLQYPSQLFAAMVWFGFGTGLLKIQLVCGPQWRSKGKRRTGHDAIISPLVVISSLAIVNGARGKVIILRPQYLTLKGGIDALSFCFHGAL